MNDHTIGIDEEAKEIYQSKIHFLKPDHALTHASGQAGVYKQFVLCDLLYAEFVVKMT